MPSTVNRRIVRQTSAVIRDTGEARPVIIALEPGGHVAHVWLKGRRTKFPLDYGNLYRLAVRSWADAEKSRKLAERKARKTEAIH